MKDALPDLKGDYGSSAPLLKGKTTRTFAIEEITKKKRVGKRECTDWGRGKLADLRVLGGESKS